MRDRALGSTVRLKFTTTDSNGAPVAPSSAFVAADFRIYKDGSATEKTTTNGITVTSPFDSVTGRHLIEIDTSNSTGDSGFWASGSMYTVELNTAKTVNSQAVSGLEIGSFSIELQTADVRKFGGTAGTFSSGRPEVNTTHLAGTSQTARDIGASVLLSSGTGTGQVSLSSGAVTVGTNNDKTGYSLTQSFPTNFSSLAITAGGAVTAGTVSDKTGYSLTATTGLGNQTANITGSLSGSVGSVTGNVGGNVTGSVGSISGVTFPSNFGSMSITVGGAVTAGTVSDKTGYSLTPTTGLGNQTANITGNLSGSVGSVSSGVTVTTNNDKTGYSLTAGTGLGNQTANITGNLSGSVGSVSGNVGGNVVGSVGSISGVTFPSNFGSMAITVGGAVTAGTVSDKTGYSLTPTTGLGNQTSNITGNLSGSVGSVSSGVTVSTNNDKTGYSLSTAPPTAAAIADAVWDEARTGHTTAGTFGFYLDAAISGISGGGGGSTAADIWAYATRTLTSALTVTTDDIDAIVAGVTAAGPGLYNVIRNDDLTLRIGDEFEQSITGLGNIASRDDLVFTLKAAESDADTAAKIYLSENSGLTRLNGAAYATTANGTITVDDAVNGDITIRISSAATASLTKATRVDAVKVLQSGGNDRTPRVGRTQVLPVVVEARG